MILFLSAKFFLYFFFLCAVIFIVPLFFLCFSAFATAVFLGICHVAFKLRQLATRAAGTVRISRGGTSERLPRPV